MKMLRTIGGWFGSVVLSAVRAILVISFVIGGAAYANYLMTIPGTGTSFASVVISTVHYAAGLICDATNGQANCSTVKAGNTAGTTDQALVVADPNVLAAVQLPIPIAKNGTPTAATGQTPGTAQTGTQVNQDMGLQAVGNTSIGSCVSTYGTGPGSVNCPGFNAAITQLPGTTYNTVAASQTAQALTGGGGGATGDLLNFCEVIPTSTSPGVVTILDNATTVYAFPGGASSLSNLVPFAIPVGSLSVSGAWKITTGANLSVVCNGKFH